MIIDNTQIEKTAHIYARFKEGVFTDLDTEKPVELKEDCIVKIVVDEIFLAEDQLKKIHFVKESKVVMKKEDQLEFNLFGTAYVFRLTLLEDLILSKKGNKLPTANATKILIAEAFNNLSNGMTPLDGFESLEVNSLNQAYFKMSTRYKPIAASHSINVYTNFYFKGKPLKTLDTLRSF